MTTQIQFLLTYRLEGYVFNPLRPQGLSFSNAATGVEIEIRAGGKEGDFEFGHGNLELRAKISCHATERQIGFVDKFLSERIVDPRETQVPLPYVIRQEEVVSSDGKIANGYSPTSDFLPIDLQALCTSKGEELKKHAVRFVRLLRWLEKAQGPEKICDCSDPRFRLYWRTNQGQYYSVPWPRQESITLTNDGFGGLTWSSEDQQTFSELWINENQHEPLGHQLLREAKEIVEQNHRSALLICYSALEVGIKQHISRCAPDAGWLAMYAPTPPLFKILRDYLPEIHKGKQAVENWAKIRPELKLIDRFVEDRNKLAHRGESISGSLDDYLRITEDLLFAFDVLEGHCWAKSRVSRHFGQLLGWKPTTRESSITIQILE
ncbi:hypothetical protein H4P12_13315 [Paracoccus sp. 11-3]|uniref:Apea-like HEPN domain-containing protein n=1 Tax=Paracoccus amoyensis TaxID=2760093 RepID=A0A926JD53_9RHOB|nr:hypothetical protein [Paracoccus amoyensis]MBC9247660.1 hypothetical protein [Paracoccus amoyensis]